MLGSGDLGIKELVSHSGEFLLPTCSIVRRALETSHDLDLKCCIDPALQPLMSMVSGGLWLPFTRMMLFIAPIIVCGLLEVMQAVTAVHFDANWFWWCDTVASAGFLAFLRFELRLSFGNMLPFILPVTIEAVCPHCAGNQPGCSFGADGKCPTLGEMTTNAAIIIGASAAIGKSLSLKISVLPRFLRAIGGPALHVIQLLAKQPAKGTEFAHTMTSTAHEILSAIGAGVYTLEQALLRISELMDQLDEDVEADAKKIKKLQMILRLLETAAKTGKLTESGGAASEAGVFTFLWAKISEFVSGKEMQVKVKLEAASTSSDDASKGSTFSAKTVRFETEMEFAEAMNLFVLFTSSLNLVHQPENCPQMTTNRKK